MLGFKRRGAFRGMPKRELSRKRVRTKRAIPDGARFAARVVAAMLAVVPLVASAHERAYYFERVSADEDLAQNTVNAMLQDRTGFVWVATQGGLHRYDGYRFELFQHNPEDPDSLPDSVEQTHVSLFDGSNCGLKVKDKPAFSVQYHPEASPGPQDSHYLFKRFVNMIREKKGEPTVPERV